MLGAYINTQPWKAEKGIWPGGGSQHDHGEEDVTELSLGWETREKQLPEQRAKGESRATTT